MSALGIAEEMLSIIVIGRMLPAEERRSGRDEATRRGKSRATGERDEEGDCQDHHCGVHSPHMRRFSLHSYSSPPLSCSPQYHFRRCGGHFARDDDEFLRRGLVQSAWYKYLYFRKTTYLKHGYPHFKRLSCYRSITCF